MEKLAVWHSFDCVCSYSYTTDCAGFQTPMLAQSSYLQAPKAHELAVLAQELGHGDSIRVRMSENPVPTINKEDLTTDWFDSLERCFRWSDRTQQKPI